MKDIPRTQYAVQLVGPDELVLNKHKEVFRPGPRQILCRVETVGLCFSDLKLLKQFSSHVRKGEVVAGLEASVLADIPSYVPGDRPTVPGHETVVRIAAVGGEVKGFSVGQRYLVQTDYRWLKTAARSNAAFGYNFEGALQEYVLVDERVVTSPEGESMFLPVGEELSGSAVALVEPWACVEDAYASTERTCIKEGGRMLVVAEADVEDDAIAYLMDLYGKPATMAWINLATTRQGDSASGSRAGRPRQTPGVQMVEAVAVGQLDDAAFDDVVYFGSNPATVESLFAKVGTNGLLNICLCGGRFGRKVSTMIGRVHYGGIRIIGTCGSSPADAMEIIPPTDEIRPGDKICVVGAGGPMGMMHVIRNICQGVEGLSVYAGDVDDGRLEALSRIAAPAAIRNNVEYIAYDAQTDRPPVKFDYIAIMAPVPALVAAAVGDGAERGLINIFAGIPATVCGEIDLDAYIEKGLYFIGTSGSTLDDMKLMLGKVQTGTLDTNVSVAAVSGLDGAVEGIRAVESRSIAGKIVVYPACKGLGLTRLEELRTKIPQVAGELDDGLWTVEAERKLLELYAK
ncbi:MAG TPA: alcohol dehydrogenase [Phycisphaerales bacterium]|nr:alcohol dehydrogenase [Phycisphaerales bacterium]